MDDEYYAADYDRDVIDIHENYQVEYWTKKLGVTRENLLESVAAAGTSAEDVKKYLN